ncbi:spore germination protein [Bacillus sp. FJAT-49711]|uniref:spore germination protein n=1 Tax=Bacillus sp. FJAT-49711 TaxID=2833585 RepID=UPI001BC9828B|nr:spore germination protein [Bacillus sp. FJAT-49711]MBS4219776.1 spore germination protein [Bacillus sp. FJAT-49711]
MPSFFKKNNQKQQEYAKPNNQLEQGLYASLKDNLEMIKNKTGNSPDITIRTLNPGVEPKTEIAIVYVEGIVDEDTINKFVVEPIMDNQETYSGSPQHLLNFLAAHGVTLGALNIASRWDGLFQSLMDGDTLIMVDGENKALIASTRGGNQRSVEQPESQVSVRGPRDGFTESIETNIALVRRRIRNPELWVESMKIGKQTKTDVSIMYLNGVVNPKIVEEVRSRLNKIEIDSILESGYIEQLIEDQTMTTFPTLYHTERPDAISGNILEGRIAIFIDGTPFVLIAPAVFIQFFQAVEDYYARFDIASALRLLRVLTFFISIMAPAIYIAGTTFHQEMIPTQLVIIIAAQRESVPFPAFVEAVLMEITFEILREAGVRMPRAVGSAISIVGALVIGQAAVQAGIVSPAMVIIVSITAIANFATPSFAMAISARLVRFLFMGVAAIFGFYGVILGIIILIVHLCSLRSFGVPYMTPFAPLSPGNLGDTFIKMPIWVTRERANLIMNPEENLHGAHMPRPRPPINRGMYKRNKSKGDKNEN